MPENDRRGLLWPLALLFLLTTAGGVIGVIISQINGASFDKRVALLLLLAASVSGALLYFPRLWLAAKVSDLATLDTRTAEIKRAILGAQGNVDQIAALTASIGTLQTAVTTLQRDVTALTGRTDIAADVAAMRASITAIETKVAKLP